MKQLVLNLSNGKIEVIEAPRPNLRKGGLLVRNFYSSISLGTETQLIKFARKNVISKALSRPDLLKELLKFAKSEGFLEAYRQAKARLDVYFPLGYSSVGEVIEVDKYTSEFKVGDIVACCGENFSSHAEIVSISENLCVKVPRDIDLKQASMAGLGAIVINSIRLSQVELGDNIAVLGTGLLGLIAVQILKNMGVRVMALDINDYRLELAKEFGANRIVNLRKSDYHTETLSFTDGLGFDKVIIFAATKSNEPIEVASEIVREKGKIIVPGLIGLEIPRKNFFEKEIDFIIPRAFGPGSFDDDYEKGKVKYPTPYVRWDIKNNLRTFIRLLEDRKINLEKIITHVVKIDDADKFYEKILDGKIKGLIGAVIEYSLNEKEIIKSDKILVKIDRKKSRKTKRKIKIGVIGAGIFARGTVLPILKKIKDVELVGVATFTGITARKVGEKYGFKYITTNYKEILKDKEIDAVFILTRHNLHAKLVKEALEHDKHVFVEKPLAMNLDELESVKIAYKKNPKIVMVGFNRRFSPFIHIAKNFINNTDQPLIINIRLNVGKPITATWVYDKEEGGGRILSEICHFIDLAYYLVGKKVRKITVFTLPIYSHYKEDDNIVSIMQFSDGSIASILYVSNGGRFPERERIEIMGGEKTCIISNFKSITCYSSNKVLKKTKKIGVDRGHEAQFRAFIEAIKMGEYNSIDFNSYLYSSYITLKFVESLKRQQTISLID